MKKRRMTRKEEERTSMRLLLWVVIGFWLTVLSLSYYSITKMAEKDVKQAIGIECINSHQLNINVMDV